MESGHVPPLNKITTSCRYQKCNFSSFQLMKSENPHRVINHFKENELCQNIAHYLSHSFQNQTKNNSHQNVHSKVVNRKVEINKTKTNI